MDTFRPLEEIRVSETVKDGTEILQFLNSFLVVLKVSCFLHFRVSRTRFLIKRFLIKNHVYCKSMSEVSMSEVSMAKMGPFNTHHASLSSSFTETAPVTLERWSE